MKYTKVEEGSQIVIDCGSNFKVTGTHIATLSTDDFTSQWHTVRVDFPNSPERDSEIYTGKLIK